MLQAVFGAPAGTRILDPLIKRLSLCTFVRLCAVVIIDISLFSSQATAPKFSQLWSKCSQTAFAM